MSGSEKRIKVSNIANYYENPRLSLLTNLTP